MKSGQWLAGAVFFALSHVVSVPSVAAENVFAPFENFDACWFAAENGDPVAYEVMGNFHARGSMPASDSKVAARWYRKAAEQGRQSAQQKLQRMGVKGPLEISSQLLPICTNEKLGRGSITGRFVQITEHPEVFGYLIEGDDGRRLDITMGNGDVPEQLRVKKGSIISMDYTAERVLDLWTAECGTDYYYVEGSGRAAAKAEQAAQAAQAASVNMLIIERDPNGTNVRDRASGRVIDVIPYAGKQSSDAELERRVVKITGQNGAWFAVSYGHGKSGWMHGSVLGSCSAATEDGDPRLHAEPRDTGSRAKRIPSDVPLRLKAVSGHWAKVSFVDANNREIFGWLPEQSMNANPYSSCWQ